MSDLKLDALVATLKQAGNWHCDKAAAAITTLRARIAALDARLEIDPAHPYDGIAARDATIDGLDASMA